MTGAGHDVEVDRQTSACCFLSTAFSFGEKTVRLDSAGRGWAEPNGESSDERQPDRETKQSPNCERELLMPHLTALPCFTCWGDAIGPVTILGLPSTCAGGRGSLAAPGL